MKILIVDNNLHIQFYPQSFLVKRCLGLRYSHSVRIRKPTDFPIEISVWTGWYSPDQLHLSVRKMNG